MPDENRPQTGDVVIWDVEPDPTSSTYWVRTHDRGSATQLFDGPDAWTHALAAARERAGPDGAIWRRHRDGHFERLG